MMKQKPSRPLTANQKRFMEIVREYNNVADNGNVMGETEWGKRQVVRIGMSLVKRGLLEYSATDNYGFEGGVWTATE